MATGYSQEKLPNETIRIGADFSTALLSGESIQAGNITVSCVNVYTGASAPSILSGSPSLSGNVVTQKVTGGASGDVYKITMQTGSTDLGMSYSAEMNLVITDAPSSALVLASRDELKRQLGVTDTSDDALLDDLLVSASSYIRNRTGRDFVLKEYNESVKPEDGNTTRLKLSQYPVKAVKRVQVIDRYNQYTLFDESDTSLFDFVPEGYVWFDFSTGEYFLPWPNENIITYIAGFPKIPEDVRKAVIDLAAGSYRAIGKEGLQEEKIGDYFYKAKKGSDLPPSLRREINDAYIEGVIARYKSHNLGWIDDTEECDD